MPGRRHVPLGDLPRFTRLHRTQAAPPAAVDLTNTRQRAAHTAAKPTILLPAGEPLRPPKRTGDPAHICQQTTITLHPDDLGTKDKSRQDPHYLTPTWQGKFKSSGRANTEGINGHLKGHHIDLGDPKSRLAHGRVAQTLLAALMVAIANELILLAASPRPARTPAQGDPRKRRTPSGLATADGCQQTTTMRLIHPADNPTALPRPPAPARPAASPLRAPSGLTPPAPFTTAATPARTGPASALKTPENAKSRPIQMIGRDPVNFLQAISRTALGGDEGIRTPDPFDANEVRYRTALHPQGLD